MIVEPVLIGDQKALFGHLTLPEAGCCDTGVVFFSAGMLHDIGPFGLYVDISRELAARGIGSLRIDQSGKGESPARQGVSRHETLLADYSDCRDLMRSRGISRIIIVGLCSGADDGIEICNEADDVVGLILLDGYARKTRQFHVNRLKRKLRNWRRVVGKVKRLLRTEARRERSSLLDLDAEMNSRTWSSDDEMTTTFRNFLDQGGHVLSIFTRGQRYYNYLGQLSEAIGPTSGKSRLCEVYFFEADHTFTAVKHRIRTVATVCDWVENVCRQRT